MRSRRLFKKLAAALQAEAEAGALNAKTTAAGYRQLQDMLERVLLPKDHPVGIERRKGAQSKQFMIQILPHIQNYMRQFARGRSFEILDVGPGAGFGANILGSLYRSLELGYRARVTTVDIRDTYHDYIRVLCRYVASHEIADIFAMAGVFDIITASHVIEHVRDPLKFCRRLQTLSSGVVFVCAPYQEQRERLTKGHANIFDDNFLTSLNADSLDLVESPAWGQFLTPRYKMFIARLPGLADPVPATSPST